MPESVFDKFPVLEIDENYYLRQISMDDQEAYYEYVMHPEVSKWVPDECLPKSFEAAIDEIQYNLDLYRYRRSVYWVIARKDNNTMIGSCGFNYWSRDHSRGEISYDLAKPYWNKGIITKAAKTVMAFAFVQMEMNRIEATVTPGNNGSLRVLQKLGFKKEGILREQKKIRNKYTDAIMHSVLRKEYLGF